MFVKIKIALLILVLPFTVAKIRTGKIENGLTETVNKRYNPNWDDLDTRPLPEWYDKAKIGIFLHWGVFSVPSFGSEWFWSNWHGKSKTIVDFMAKNYPPSFTYQDFAPMFTAEFFDSNEWATLFKNAGARYIVLTSKHHEGYTLFPSKRSFSWNAMEVGPRRDLVGELSESVRSKGLKFGVYHSLYEWFNPIYAEDAENLYATRNYPDTKLWPDIKQLVNDYKPSVLWSDGDWDTYDTYWNSTGLLAWLYNDSPVKNEIVTNDRWGKNCYGKHGDFYNYADRFNPGKLLSHKWENAFTLDSKSWGYRRNVQLGDILSFDDLLYQVVSSVSCGGLQEALMNVGEFTAGSEEPLMRRYRQETQRGNALINVGPTKEGTITPIYQERLLSLGKWLEINGEAIYESSPWLHQNDSANGDVWYTCRKTEYNALRPTSLPTRSDTVTAIYAVLLKWPEGGQLQVHDVMPTLHSGNYKVELLGNKDVIQWNIINGEAVINLPDKATVKSAHAWTLKFTLK